MGGAFVGGATRGDCLCVGGATGRDSFSFVGNVFVGGATCGDSLLKFMIIQSIRTGLKP